MKKKKFSLPSVAADILTKSVPVTTQALTSFSFTRSTGILRRLEMSSFVSCVIIPTLFAIALAVIG